MNCLRSKLILTSSYFYEQNERLLMESSFQSLHQSIFAHLHSVFWHACERFEPASLVSLKWLMTQGLLNVTETHLLEPSLHHDLIQQVPALQVIHPSKVVFCPYLFVLEEEVDSIYSHRFEVSTEFLVAYYLYQVPK